MISDKRSVHYILAYLAEHGIADVVISPGSRNAPLTYSFNASSKFRAYSIVDERCAGFFALGMAQQMKKPVVLSCTSGTALLNYGPAIAEAFYQNIPLVVISADRPEKWLHQGLGQTIDQKEVFQNFINASVHLPEDGTEKMDELLSDIFYKMRTQRMGPIHINVPFDEPLYNYVEEQDIEIHPIMNDPIHLNPDLDEVLKALNEADRILILTGVLNIDDRLNKELSAFAKRENVMVMTETSSNLYSADFFPCTDRMIFNFEEEDIRSFQPDVLITLGTNVVSKKIKQILQKDPPKYHWHIDPKGQEVDTFDCLSDVIKIEQIDFLQGIQNCERNISSYKVFHQKREGENIEKHNEYLSLCEFSDLKVFESILKEIPSNSMLQMGNSSVIRYIQLFDQREDLIYFANRGTSGIDGCTSTAIGAALASDRPCTLISGDVAFFYDSNALWNKYIPDHFKVIIINNSGGGIFRIIPGPETTGVMEEYFETRHQLNASHLAKMHGLNYASANDMESMTDALKSLYSDEKPAILEIFTPAEKNDEILRSYFKCLKQTKEQISTGELSKNTKT